MITLKSYIAEAKNQHMEHLEDLVFNLGVDGTRKAIFFMRDVRDMLSQGSGKPQANITVKWDGAPAVFAGINPENGKFFVAKKGLFNKNPKLYYSEADVAADTSGDLADKLKTAFRECKKLGIKSGVYQGDIMFTQKDLKREKIDGTDYVTFHPNTILYAVPTNSALGKKISKSQIGIVWHTTYSGDTISTLSASFGKDIVRHFAKSNSSWMEDATFKDVTGKATFTDKERQQVDALLSAIGSKFRTVPSQTLNAIHQDTDLLGLVHIFNNSQVRSGKKIAQSKSYADDLYDFIYERYGKEIESKKSEKGKKTWSDKRDKVLTFFNTHPKADIAKIFELTAMIAECKELLVNKLNRAGSVGTFLKTSTGFRVTAPEGFVAIGNSGAVKLVDRLEFSRANFSPDIIKGWQR